MYAANYNNRCRDSWNQCDSGKITLDVDDKHY